jgi:hypothetical protein
MYLRGDEELNGDEDVKQLASFAVNYDGISREIVKK